MVSRDPNGLAWRQMVYYKPKWFSVTAVGLRNNRQKYKREMDKSSLKWNSLCGVQRHNYVIQIEFDAKIRQNEVFATPSIRRSTQEKNYFCSLVYWTQRASLR